jgi:hypothetical protein
MILDQAFDAKGQFTIRSPVRFIRDRILDTEWKKNYAWRPFLDPLIIGLGDQQLITGYAVLLSGWIKVRHAHRRRIQAHGAPLGVPKFLRSPRRTLRSGSLRLRALVVVAPSRTHHAAEVLPPLPPHCQNSPHTRHRLRVFLACVYDCSDRYAGAGTTHAARRAGKAVSCPAAVVPRTHVFHHRGVLDGTCVYHVDAAAQDCIATRDKHLEPRRPRGAS